MRSSSLTRSALSRKLVPRPWKISTTHSDRTLEAFAIVGEFTLTKHYPNHRRQGTALLMALALGTAATIMTALPQFRLGGMEFGSLPSVEHYLGIWMVLILVGERCLLPAREGYRSKTA